MSLFQRRQQPALIDPTKTTDPEELARLLPALHPVKRALLLALNRLDKIMEQREEVPADLPLPLLLSVRSAVPIGRTLLTKLTDAQCDKLLAFLNTVNAELCYECNVTPLYYGVRPGASTQANGQASNGGDDGMRQDDVSPGAVQVP